MGVGDPSEGSYESVASVSEEDLLLDGFNTMGTPSNQPRYEDVPDNNDDEFSSDDEIPRRSRHRRSRSNDPTGGWIRTLWVLIAAVMVLSLGAVLGWRQWTGGNNLLGYSSSMNDANSNEHNKGVPRVNISVADNDMDEENDDENFPKDDGIEVTEVQPKIVIPPSNLASVTYDPSASLHSYNPFDFKEADWYGSVLIPPPLHSDHDVDDSDPPLGYLHGPSVVNNTVVFLSEGDMYLAKIDQSARSLPAMKLTTTVGNVLSPMINPVYPYWISYTATYTGRREVYLMDLRPSHRHTPALRLTYWDGPNGVSHIVGWKNDGQTLIFSAQSNEISLPDTRLYELGLVQEGVSSNSDDQKKYRRLGHHWPVHVLQILPIPLAQAIDGVYDKTNECVYFTRFRQSSNTARYVGGTVESLWAYCRSAVQKVAVPLTTDYKGTSKTPTIMTRKDGKDILLFVSDRVERDGQLIPSTMNLFALPLPSQEDLYNSASPTLQKPIQITHVSCEFNGMHLREYALDTVTNNVVIRVGADLLLLTSEKIELALTSRRRIEDLNNSTDSPGEVDGEKNSSDGNDKNELTGTQSDENAKTSVNIERNVDDENISNIPASTSFQRLPIVVYSDFSQHFERSIPVILSADLKNYDVYETIYGSTSVLMTLRGQVYVAPVVANLAQRNDYAGAGMNLPQRRYRVAPGSTTGGVLRVLTACHVPLWQEVNKSSRHLALLLATDPISDTAEHGFYLVETQADSAPSFVDVSDFPEPFLGGSTNGGSVADGGLGSVNPSSVKVSPCGRRLVWTDTDGRICVMTLPLYQNNEEESAKHVILPELNEQGEPMVGTNCEVSWSPGGRYLAVTHSARNQFQVISIVDLGEPEQEDSTEVRDIKIGRIVQATPDRFNSVDPYFGRTAHEIKMASLAALQNEILGKPDDSMAATTLYFLSDRDIISDVQSPWGTRAPDPHFPNSRSVYALPLSEAVENILDPSRGAFAGEGAAELFADRIIESKEVTEALLSSMATGQKLGARRVKDKASKDPAVLTNSPASSTGSSSNKDTVKTTSSPVSSSTSTGSPSVNNTPLPTSSSTSTPSISTGSPSVLPSSVPSSTPLRTSPFPRDREFSLGFGGFEFARRAYRIANIPAGNYALISQAIDDPSLVLFEKGSDGMASIKVCSFTDYPSDAITSIPVSFPGKVLQSFGLSTTRNHLLVMYSESMKVFENTAAGISSFFADVAYTKGIVDADLLALSVWPSLEYHQMYNDAWRMLRDYFYDRDMTGINWPEVHARYFPLVKRCVKREDLDDVLMQMASELSALHVFVYGGEYSSPVHNSAVLGYLNDVASLGATLERSADWSGYVVTSIPERDPDFNLKSGKSLYSPLSDQTLRLSGQRGLVVGDVIVGVNGESVMRVPDIHMLLRGKAGQSVRLDVLRLTSNIATRRFLEEGGSINNETIIPEPIITVPISSSDAGDLRYDAWEWKTRELAKDLAKQKDFQVGYVHLQSMSKNDIEAFVRGFYPDYNKEALIIDVRHNRGGNIDRWLLDTLQRKAWMFWQSRTMNITSGGLGWNEHSAFRGHLVVLMDEHTSSDGEGFSRGVSELGLGKLIGTRTWGGGIWLASDNKLVDGGIASAPEIGTFNDNFGWGLGIENLGVEPDIEVDNNPRTAYDGKDDVLAKAIDYIAQWLEEVPIVFPRAPGKKDNSLQAEGCLAN